MMMVAFNWVWLDRMGAICLAQVIFRLHQIIRVEGLESNKLIVNG